MTTSNVHLLVLIHGMWGNPGHLAEMRRIFEERHCGKDSTDSDGIQIRILVAETNAGESTYDGIDWGAERVAEEVYEEIKKLEEEGKKVSRFSVTGYSLGGLVARYLIGILYQRKFFNTIKPVNFNTFASPHIGLLRYSSFRSRLFALLGPVLLSRTGEQFYVVDKWSASGRPLLEVMADPEQIFYKALLLFPRVHIYANSVNDMTVPFITSAIEYEDPFYDHETNGLEVVTDEKYSHVITSWGLPDTPPTPKKLRPFSREWLQSSLPRPPRLIWLRTKYPYNIIIALLLPLLIPSFFLLAIARTSLSTRSSRKRIRMLESGSGARERLVHVFATLEKEIEDVVVDIMDSGYEAPTTESLASPSHTLVALAGEAPESASYGTVKPSRVVIPRDAFAGRKLAMTRPRLTVVQLQIIGALNTLPQLKKTFVFLHPLPNSHATIVSRDVKNFEFHQKGWGVLQHWADHFVV